MAIAQTKATTPQAPTPDSPATERARALGLPSATALVIGSIIGTGVFTMPAVMAGAGTSSILILGVIAVGAVLLGTMFGQLTKRVPNVDGGLYAYARHEFGDFAGYLTAWCYWITCWAGNAAIVVLVGALRRVALRHHNPSAWTNFGIALTGLVDPGRHQPRRRPPDGVVPERHRRPEVPAAGCWSAWSAGSSSSRRNFGPFNASGGSLYNGIGIAAGVALFSFIGVECASIAAGRVKNPRRNVGRASVLGTAAQRPAVPGRDRRRHGPRLPPATWSATARPSWPPSRRCSVTPLGSASSSPPPP